MTVLCDCGCGRVASFHVKVLPDNQWYDASCENCNEPVPQPEHFEINIFDGRCHCEQWTIDEWWMSTAEIRVFSECTKCGEEVETDTLKALSTWI